MIELLTLLLNKFLLTLFVFSGLAVIRLVYLFLYNFTRPTPKQLTLNKRELIAIGVFVSFIVASIVGGISL